MQRRNSWVIPVLLVFAAAIAIGFYLLRPPATTPVATPVVVPLPPPVAPDPVIAHPLPATTEPAPDLPPQPPLPALDDSDMPVQGALSAIVGPDNVKRFLLPEQLVRRIVATIDNLPREKLAVKLRPVTAPPGPFLVRGERDDEEADMVVAVLHPDNYARYRPFVNLLQATSAQRIVTVYVRYYPLFQQAYEDLGYPTQYFNDRLVEVIDHLLATPEVRDPVALVRPHVFYQFADPGVEALSSGQKLLVRMGGENAAAVKAWLRELRAQVASLER